ncbi:MAG TPA: hypothetical protein VGR20_00190 [Acidimicrobiia bacterium]|nr:hypothetical protein [Acidimicrobiia bacterium]
MRMWAKLSLMAALLLTVGTTPPVRAAAGAFQIGLIGDTGYTPDGETNLLKVRGSANASGLAFVVHDGDIWQGGTPCSDDRLRRVKAVLNGFTTLVYTPGDNEWQDCPDPAGRLPAIRKVFFSTAMSLGSRPIAQVRQQSVPENARWERGGVVFATLDVPGPGGGGPTTGADGAWLDATFDRATAVHAAAVMIIWQDDPTDGSSSALVARLRRRAAAFTKPVVLVHGDTHQYKLDHPWKDTPNLTRLETYPGFTPQWVKATVDPAAPGVFRFSTVRG